MDLLTPQLKHRAKVIWLVCSLLLSTFPCRGSVIFTTIDINDILSPKLYHDLTPSFVIAEMGVRHEINPVYDEPLLGIGPDWQPPEYAYQFTLTEAPAGMSVSPAGILEWIPTSNQIDDLESFTLTIDVIEEGEEIFTATKTFSMTVVAEFPQLRENIEVNGYEGGGLIGSTGIGFEDFQPSDADEELFTWSLVGPPPGVFLNSSGALSWTDDRGYARVEPYTFKIRIDYETASGPVFSEATYTRRVLPEQATYNYNDLRTTFQSQSGGMLGYSTAEGDGWLAVGEPYPSFATNGTGNTGRVRIWKYDTLQDRYEEILLIQPQFAVGAVAFGASVSISEAGDGHPTRLAVGAPESSRPGSDGYTLFGVGHVQVYSVDENGVWSDEGQLDPPVVDRGLHFGGWVSIQGDTLVASMEGEDSAGSNTGALVVFTHDGSSWNYSETLSAPTPAFGDYFSYPCAIDGDWIASAANEDDDDGLDSGSVHLFQKQGASFVHRQRITAPQPEVEALFGERLLLEGPWLFVSSFREADDTGAVHVFKESGGIWSFHQTLLSPFAEPGSAFGVGLALSENVLAVSAPGYIYGSTTIDGSRYAWDGITLFELDGDQWQWSRQVTENPDSRPGPSGWGYFLAQPTPDITIATVPDYRRSVSGETRLLAGHFYVHRWPDRIPDPFLEILDGLPLVDGLPATADGDSNENGIPNILEWMMGHDPGQATGGFYTLDMRQPFIDHGGEGLRLMVPKLKRGLGYRVEVKSSEDLYTWQTTSEARWESLAVVYFRQPEGSQKVTNFHPVTIPSTGEQHFFKLQVEPIEP